MLMINNKVKTFTAVLASTTASAASVLALAVPSYAQANGAVANAPYPQVMVNNQPVQFPGQPPIEQGGRVLVPLRGVLEKLGAYVDFDARTNTVIAFRAGKRITLPIGASSATVNDQPVHLDVPAQIVNGSTLVPLRFVAQALGAQVAFDVSSDTVNITMGADTAPIAVAPNPADAERARAEAEARARTDAQRKADEARHRAADAERQRLNNLNAVVGTAVAVYTDVTPQRIVVHVPPTSGNGAGTDRTIPLRGDARIAVQLPNTPEQTIALSQINAGDLVSVLENGKGDAVAVNRIAPPAGARPPKPRNPDDVSSVFKGEFLDYKKQGDTYILLMTDNRTIEVPRDVPVLYDNQQIGADDLRSGDDLTIAVDPKTHRGTRILVAPEQ